MTLQRVRDRVPTENRPPDPQTRTATPAGPRSGGNATANTEAGKPKAYYGTGEKKSNNDLGLEGVFEAVTDEKVEALDTPLLVTEFKNVQATRKREVTTTLRELAARVHASHAPSKKTLPLLKLATFGNIPRVPGGSLRHDANLISVEGVEADYDAGVMGVEEAARRLRRAGLAALIYTTPSHAAESPRWRVLCPLAHPASPEARDALCARLNGVFSGVLAPESFTRSQSYYFGRVDGTAGQRVELVEGAALDAQSDTLDVFALGRDGRPWGMADVTSEVAEGGDLGGEPDWPRIRSALDAIPVQARGDREGCWLRIGMALHGESGADEEAFALWDAWSQASPKYDASDQLRVWESFGEHARTPVRIGTLFRIAKDHGWHGQAAGGRSHLTFLSPGDCAATPSRGYVLKGILVPGDVGCIFGAPGAGKSLIAPHLGYRVAQGLQAFGMRTRPGSVFYVAAEDPHGMRGRIQALQMAHGNAEAFQLVQGVSDLLSTDSPDLTALMEAVDAQRPALIFLDTLAMSFPGLEENTAEGMGKVVAVARRLTAHGAAVVLIHHDTKAEGSTPRGHSLLNGALDMALQLFGADDQGVVRGRLTKNRNGACDRDIAFRIGTRDLGVDEDGDAVTAALVDELAVGTAPRREKLNAPESAALDALREMIERDGEQRPGGGARREGRALEA